MIFLFYPRQAGANQPEESQEKTEFLREKKSSINKEERNAKGSRTKMHHFLNPQCHMRVICSRSILQTEQLLFNRGRLKGNGGNPCVLSKDLFENICDPALPR